jgi:periplasmic protein TonB
MSRSTSIVVLGSLFVMAASTAPSVAGTRRAPALCNAPAAISTEVPAEYPALAAEQKLSGKALVQVDLERTGTVRHATIVRTSGSSSLDRAALTAARSQTYSPEMVACRPVGGSYLIDVNFQQ